MRDNTEIHLLIPPPSARHRRRKAAVVGLLGLMGLLAVMYGPEAWRWVNRQKQRVLYDRLYGADTADYPTAPNAFLMEVAPSMATGRALDVAMGQGRNAVYLARNGWEVTGFDISEKALHLARINARQAGVKMTAACQSVSDFNYGHECWDLVVLIYAPVPLENGRYMKRLRESLCPGGYVVYTSYAGRESADDMLLCVGHLDSAGLRRAFEGFEILRLEETDAINEWTATRERLVHLLARKK